MSAPREGSSGGRGDPEGRGQEADGALRARVDRLEREVEELRRAVAGNSAPALGAPPASGAAPASATRTRSFGSRTAADWLKLGEDWLGRIGIGLLLLGLAFLYRYAIDRGWIVPELRVAFGLAVGGALLAVGWRWTPRRPFYSQVLLGGSIAVLYLTGWAAQVLYELVPWALGFAFMAAVTVLALALAERGRHQVLAVIGTSGAFATPFLLDSPREDATGLVLYALLVLGWAGALQLRRGWRALLAVNVFGGAAVVAVAVGLAPESNRYTVQLGVVALWTVACAFPFLRGWLGARGAAVASDGGSDAGGAHAHNHALLWLLAVGVSSLAVAYTAGVWDLGRAGTGAAFVGAAFVLLAGSHLLDAHGRGAGGEHAAAGAGAPAASAGAAAARAGAAAASAAPRRAGVDPLARPGLEAGALLLVAGTALVAGRDWFALPVAVEGAGLFWVARQKGVPSLRGLAHVVFALLAADFLRQLQVTGDAFGPYPLGILGAIGVAAAGGAAWLRRGTAAESAAPANGTAAEPAVAATTGSRIYLLASYVAFLVWLAWQLTPLAGGHGLTSGAWAATALVVLGLGARIRSATARMTGLLTLAAVAAKLLLVDLDALDAGLRIALFLGFGALFLFLGYLFQGRDAE